MCSRISSLLILIIALSFSAFGQGNEIEITWDQLKSLQFEEAYDEGTGGFYEKPVFGFVQKSLAGKKVKITGYVLPMDAELNYYVVSAFPISSCFFCGGAGPESVIDLQLSKSNQRFENDQRVSFCGTLRLNEGNVLELPYILLNAEVCEE